MVSLQIIFMVKFIVFNFNSPQIYAQSSDTERCIVSAYSTLTGIFSRTSNMATDLNPPYETWRAYPVHTVPYAYDEVSSSKTMN